MCSLRTDQGGFSLVEGLVAAALVALGFLAVLNLFPAAYSNITYGGNQTLAAQYAMQKIEQLKNLPFDSINSTACSSVNVDDLGNGFSRSCILTINVGVGSLGGGGDDDDDGGGGGASLARDLKKVQVRVTWPGQYRPGSLSVETLFTR